MRLREVGLQLDFRTDPKISGTAKYKALKVAGKLLFPRRPLLPLLIFSFAVIFTQSTAVSWQETTDSGAKLDKICWRCKYFTEKFRKREFLYSPSPTSYQSYTVSYAPTDDRIPNRLGGVFPTDWELCSQRLGLLFPTDWKSSSWAKAVDLPAADSSHRSTVPDASPASPTSPPIRQNRHPRPWIIAFRTNFNDNPVLIRLKKRNFATKTKV